jgi:hypothetical protein
MSRLSSLAALMLVNGYVCALLGLILLALNPAVDWTIGFFLLMLFFYYATGPVLRIAKRLVFRRPVARSNRISGAADA